MDKALLQRNLQNVEQRLRAACQRAGRDRDEVTLVAVTKTVAAEVARLIVDLGVRDLGENRPQELWRKAAVLAPVADASGSEIRWHLIGHLQRNKIERTLSVAALLHSVDSVRLLEELNRHGDKLDRRLDLLLEFNLGGEASKQGFGPDDADSLASLVAQLPHIHLRGLMTMAPLQEAEQCRPLFAELRKLRDFFAAELTPHHQVRDLSMGMSNDFDVAVEEGATLVRLGTVLFQESS